jgi:hypothetical protein
MIFSKAYLLSFLEQMLIAFGLAFGAVATATDGGFTKAAILGGAAAGVRAIYGTFVSQLGSSKLPSIVGAGTPAPTNVAPAPPVA